MKKSILIRQLLPNEAIPYNLLLLADEAIEAIDKYIHASEIYICEKNNRIIAIYVLEIIDYESAEIKNIAVDKVFQGQGIGTQLLKNAFENGTKRGFRTLLIGTGNTASKQLDLYQKLGFEKFKVIENFFVDNYPEPIFENGKQLKDMVVLKKTVIHCLILILTLYLTLK